MNCQKAKCPFEARWYPVFIIRPDTTLYPNAPGVQSMAGVALCDSCRTFITAEELLTESGWELIEALFRMTWPTFTPHRPSTGMEFVEISTMGNIMMRRGEI